MFSGFHVYFLFCRTAGSKSVSNWKVLRQAISTQDFLDSFGLDASSEMVPYFQIATSCFVCKAPDLNSLKLKPLSRNTSIKSF